MSEPSGRAVVERFVRAVEESDFETMAGLLADDVVDETPQSGERTRGRDNYLAIRREYPGGAITVQPGTGRIVGSEDRWVLTPSFNILKVEGSGDVYTYAGTVRYPNGEIWHVIVILELRDAKIARMTSWYGEPFEAAEWRAPYVERFQPPHLDR